MMTNYELVKIIRTNYPDSMIEIEVNDESMQGGVASITPAGEPYLNYGADDGSDDGVVPMEYFNNSITITNITLY